MTATLAPQTQLSPAPQASPRGAQPHRGLYRLSLVTLATTLPLLVLGAMTTSTGSGMAFRDWPLANGSLWPEMELDGYLEHVHRVVATLVGLQILAMTIWALKADAATWRRRVTIALLGLVVCQGLLGGFGVLLNTPLITSSAHGVLAQAVVALLVFTAFAYSPAWQRAPLRLPQGTVRGARKLAKVALVCLFLQLALGSIGRHGSGEGHGWAIWLHVGFSAVVSVMVLITAAYTSARIGHNAEGHAIGGEVRQGIRNNVRWAMGLLVLQLTLGLFTLAMRSDKDPSNIERLGSAGVVSSHVVIGAALLCTMALLAYRLHRSVLVGDGAAPGASA